MAEEKTDNELMVEFSNCSTRAYESIFNKYKERLLNYIIKSFQIPRDDSEDIVSKTLIKVYEYKFKYKPIYQFSTWIYTIARNLAINEKNRKKHISIDNDKDDTNSFELESEENLEHDLVESDIKTQVRATLNSLDPKYREIIVMRYLEELSYDEIAAITGKNVNTLKSLAKRGLEIIKEKLKRQGIENE